MELRPNTIEPRARVTPRQRIPSRARRSIHFACFVLLCCSWACTGRAADTAAAPPRPVAAAPTVKDLLDKLSTFQMDATLIAELRQLIGSTDAPTSLVDNEAAAWSDRRKEALAQLDAALQWATKAADFEKQANDAPARLAQLREKLAHLSGEPEAMPPAAPLPELEQKLADRQAAFAKSQEALIQAEDEIKHRAARRVEIPKLIATASSRLEELERLLANPAAEDVPDELVAANRAATLAEKLARRAEVDSYQKEILKYDATAEVVPLERDKAARELHHNERILKDLRTLVDQRRTDDAQRSAQQAQAVLDRATKAHPSVRAIAAENAQLAQQRKDLAEKLQRMTQELERERGSSAPLLKHFKEMQDKGGLADISDRGLLLYKQIKLLPDEHRLQRNLKSVANRLSDAQFEQLDLVTKRSDIADPERVITAQLGSLDKQPQLLISTMEQYLDIERGTLDALLTTYEQYVQKLTQMQTYWEEMLKKTSEYREYIAERVLWIRSTGPLQLDDFADVQPIGAWLADPDEWYASMRMLLDDALRTPALYLMAGVGSASLMFLRVRMRNRVRELGEIAARGRTDSFRPTAAAAVYTALIAVAWTAFPCFIAWRLSTAPAGDSHARAIGCAVLISALIYLPLELLRQVCRQRGLAEAHFDWPRHGISLLRRSLRELMILTLPLVLITSMLHVHGNDHWDSSIGRIAYLLAMFAVTHFLWRALNPAKGVLEEVLARDEAGWLNRLRWVWFPMAVGGPLALAGLAGAGYYYTSLQLGWRLEATLALLLGLVLIHSFLTRLLIVVRRRLAIEQAKQRRAAHIEHRDPGVDTNEAALELERLDLAVVSLQTRHLLQSVTICALMVGMCAIWVDVLPALKKLNEYELWQATVHSTAASGQASITATSITLGHLLGSLLICMMTFLAARNIPGLIEISILQRLPLRAGTGYAITTICRYCIVVVGLFWAASEIGLQWSQVQWLIAAVSVGLGFGLQEIFGNFISGLIILFERPIRVGDTITVGQLSGTVSRIRMRATTVLDADRKELIIPNKEFITGQVINWTLSDDIIRMVIRLHVDLGTDTVLAQRLILKAAQEHPNVLKDPSPSAFLESMQEQCFEFQLSVYLPGLAGGSLTRHELLETISQSFRSAGIQIAPPQTAIIPRRRSA